MRAILLNGVPANNIFLVFPLIVLFALPANAQPAADVSDQEHFNLWNNCQPIGLKVSLHSAAEAYGIVEDASIVNEQVVEIRAHTRLRQARIYSDTILHPHLVVSVIRQVFGEYDFLVSYVQIMERPGMSSPYNTGYVSTWQMRDSTQEDADPTEIFFRLDSLMSFFIDAYLRVNAIACDGP